MDGIRIAYKKSARGAGVLRHVPENPHTICDGLEAPRKRRLKPHAIRPDRGQCPHLAFREASDGHRERPPERWPFSFSAENLGSCISGTVRDTIWLDLLPVAPFAGLPYDPGRKSLKTGEAATAGHARRGDAGCRLHEWRDDKDLSRRYVAAD